MRRSSSPAAPRTRCQGFWMPTKCPSPRSAGRTYGLPSWRGNSASARSAGAPSGTVLAPVLLSGSIRQPRSKWIHSHRSDRISDRRHPVRIRSRIAAMADGGSLPSVPSNASASRASSSAERNRSRLLSPEFFGVSARVRSRWTLSPNLGHLEEVREQCAAAVGVCRHVPPAGVEFGDMGRGDVLELQFAERRLDMQAKVALVLLDGSWLLVGL